MAPPKSSAGSSSRGIVGWFKLFAVLIGIFYPIAYMLEQNLEKFYIFELSHLEDVSQRAIKAHSNDTRAIVSYIVNELGAKVTTKNFINHDEEWVFNNAGGAMGAMYIIHASITEYLIIFGRYSVLPFIFGGCCCFGPELIHESLHSGSAVGTEGHSGRHTADDYFHILTGEQWAYVPGEYEREVYPAGSVHWMRRGEVKQYRIPEYCFAMEYARGWIPPMLFFGYADTFTSTLDFYTLWRTTYVTGREMVGNLLMGKL